MKGLAYGTWFDSLLLLYSEQTQFDSDRHSGQPYKHGGQFRRLYADPVTGSIVGEGSILILILKSH